MMIQEPAAHQAYLNLMYLLRNGVSSPVHNKLPFFAVRACLATQLRRAYDYVGLALWILRDRCI